MFWILYPLLHSQVSALALKIVWFDYSIVKDSSADLGVNSKIVQIRPTVKAVCTKMSNFFFCIFVNILIFLNESREDHFEYFEYLRKTALY